jgi:hypothetical protein
MTILTVGIDLAKNVSPTDPSRILAFLRRRRPTLRPKSRFDAEEALCPLRAGVR